MKDEHEEKLKHNVPVTKALEIGTHPNDRSSLQYRDTINPDYHNDNKDTEKWYNMCPKCRKFIQTDWI